MKNKKKIKPYFSKLFVEFNLLKTTKKATSSSVICDPLLIILGGSVTGPHGTIMKEGTLSSP